MREWLERSSERQAPLQACVENLPGRTEPMMARIGRGPWTNEMEHFERQAGREDQGGRRRRWRRQRDQHHDRGRPRPAWTSSPRTPTSRRSRRTTRRSRSRSARPSPRDSAPAPTPRSAARRRWRTATRSPTRSRARTWCSSPPAWVAARAPAPPRSSPTSPGRSAR